MSRVKSYNSLQFASAPPSENSMAVTNYTNNVVFISVERYFVFDIKGFGKEINKNGACM